MDPRNKIIANLNTQIEIQGKIIEAQEKLINSLDKTVFELQKRLKDYTTELEKCLYHENTWGGYQDF